MSEAKRKLWDLKRLQSFKQASQMPAQDDDALAMPPQRSIREADYQGMRRGVSVPSFDIYRWDDHHSAVDHVISA